MKYSNQTDDSYLILTVVGNDDTDKQSQSYHTANKHKQVNEDGMHLKYHTNTLMVFFSV